MILTRNKLLHRHVNNIDAFVFISLYFCCPPPPFFFIIYQFIVLLLLSIDPCPRGLTFTWWGCYGLCPRQKPTELTHSFYSVLVSVSVFMALSTVFHSINSPDNSPLSHAVLLVLLCLIGPFDYISLYESLPQP